VIFADRSDAGKRLALLLAGHRVEHPLVLGLARGGVIVAAEIASALGAELDVLIVRKLGVPGAEEFALGAIAPGVVLINQELVTQLDLSNEAVADVIARETEELSRREQTYRGNRQSPHIEGRTVILVDDGLATGTTAQAAVQSVRRLRPKQVIFAVPVCARDGADALRQLVEEVVCLEYPLDFQAVSLWYHHFPSASDAQVLRALRLSAAEAGAPL
jgi:predicted phosphoribosyltransferase